RRCLRVVSRNASVRSNRFMRSAASLTVSAISRRWAVRPAWTWCHVLGPTAALTPQAAAERRRANHATFRRSVVALRLLYRYPSSTPHRMLAKEPRMPDSQPVNVERSGDRLTLEGLRRHLTTDIVGHHVYLFRTVDSTNRALARLADRGASEGTVLLAEEQTAGRGRHGSAW